MNRNIIKTIFALAMGAVLLAGCEKVTIGEDSLIGQWGYEEYVGMPVVMTINADGSATYYVGPGCFGESHTTDFNWRLTDKGHKVYFAVEGQTNPSIKWEIVEVKEDELVVKERYRSEDDEYSEAVRRTYSRIL